MLPCDEDGLQDDEINLGASGTRWKDLYLTGNITGATQVTQDVNTSSLALAGGTDSNVGANILLYGGSHSSLAGVVRFRNGSTETARIDSSGRVIVGKTSNSSSTAGTTLYSNGKIEGVRDGDVVHSFNRLSSDGTILSFQKDGTTVGSIGKTDGQTDIYIGSGDVGLRFGDNIDQIIPYDPSTNDSRDNAIDLGRSNVRFDDVFATNGTIQTSDENEKQDIASATDKELSVAKKLSTLFKTFRWRDKVVEKGDKARTHTGIVAQEVKSAFEAEGLDATKYGLFISDTWTNDDGKEQTRLGVRYPELFSFIFSSIEARLTALEGK